MKTRTLPAIWLDRRPTTKRLPKHMPLEEFVIPRLARLFLILSVSFILLASAFAAGNGNSKVQLNQNWALQSSAKITQGGDVLSTTNFHPEGWYDVTVPTTVVAALVKHNVYPDPYYGMNMRSIPGTVYPIGSNFSNIAMPESSPFAVPIL